MTSRILIGGTELDEKSRRVSNWRAAIKNYMYIERVDTYMYVYIYV